MGTVWAGPGFVSAERSVLTQLSRSDCRSEASTSSTYSSKYRVSKGA
jgi:hypothetical protein